MQKSLQIALSQLMIINNLDFFFKILLFLTSLEETSCGNQSRKSSYEDGIALVGNTLAGKFGLQEGLQGE